MQTRNWIYSILFAALLVTSFVLLNSSAPAKKAPVRVEAPVCCKQKMGTCTPSAKPQNSTGEMIIENLSRQFISATPLIN